MTTLMATPIQFERISKIIECHNQVLSTRNHIKSLYGQDISPYQIMDSLLMSKYERGFFEERITPSECSDPEARRKLWKDEKARMIAFADECYKDKLKSAIEASSQKGEFKATIFVASRIFNFDIDYYDYLGDERQMIQSWLYSQNWFCLEEFSFSLHPTTGCTKDLYPREEPWPAAGHAITLHW